MSSHFRVREARDTKQTKRTARCGSETSTFSVSWSSAKHDDRESEPIRENQCRRQGLILILYPDEASNPSVSLKTTQTIKRPVRSFIDLAGKWIGDERTVKGSDEETGGDRGGVVGVPVVVPVPPTIVPVEVPDVQVAVRIANARKTPSVTPPVECSSGWIVFAISNRLTSRAKFLHVKDSRTTRYFEP